jgi:hypothetical protein
MRNYYTVATIKRCSVVTRDHEVTTTLVRKGYRNDTLRVECSCGGEWKALTYARRK